MQVRFLATGLFLFGATLLLNAHWASAQQMRMGVPSTPSTQPAAVGEGAMSETARAQTQPAGSAAGKAAAPDFTLKDQNGKAVSLSDYAGKIVVLEWINPECPFVQRHYEGKTMQSLADKYDEKGVVWLAINSTNTASAASNKAWVEKYDLKYAILDDSGGKVGKLYGAKTTPHMYIIDRSGRLVYTGGIDNDPQGNKQDRVNYVDQTLQKLTEGQNVELLETKPYGCSVKYPKGSAQAR